MMAKQAPFVGIGLVIVAIVLFAVLHRGGNSTDVTTGVTRIEFKNGAPVGGVHDITVNKGSRVRLAVTPDVTAEVHVHGYEIQKDVRPGKTARLDFPATIDGAFDVEVHHLVHGQEQGGVQVASLNVEP